MFTLLVQETQPTTVQITENATTDEVELAIITTASAQDILTDLGQETESSTNQEHEHDFYQTTEQTMILDLELKESTLDIIIDLNHPKSVIYASESSAVQISLATLLVLLALFL